MSDTPDTTGLREAVERMADTWDALGSSSIHGSRVIAEHVADVRDLLAAHPTPEPKCGDYPAPCNHDEGDCPDDGPEPDAGDVGCDCTELCSMGPTCPGGMLAGLPGSGCWRTELTEYRPEATVFTTHERHVTYMYDEATVERIVAERTRVAREQGRAEADAGWAAAVARVVRDFSSCWCLPDERVQDCPQHGDGSCQHMAAAAAVAVRALLTADHAEALRKRDAEKWDEGVDAAFRGVITRQNAADVKRANPYRAEGESRG